MAGLLALVAFASAAVAVTAGGSSTNTSTTTAAQAPAAQTFVRGSDARFDDARGSDGHDRSDGGRRGR